jgi:hypothetical protein
MSPLMIAICINMNKKLLIIMAIVGLITAGLFFVKSLSKDHDEYFSHIELPNNNIVVNRLNNVKYYDTIARVGLSQAGLQDLKVIIDTLPAKLINNFEGNLKGATVYDNGIFYLYIKEYDRQTAIEIIAHEIIHIDQYNRKDLFVLNGNVVWQNKPYNLGDSEYELRPWELEAFNKQRTLIQKIQKILYQEAK